MIIQRNNEKDLLKSAKCFINSHETLGLATEYYPIFPLIQLRPLQKSASDFGSTQFESPEPFGRIWVCVHTQLASSPGFTP